MSTAQLDLGKIEGFRRKALVLAAVGLAIFAAGFVTNRTQFFVSYLQSFIMWLGLPLGCMGILMVANLTGARWAKPIRPILESAYHTIPIMALLFLPIVFGGKSLYPWMNLDFMHADKVLMKKIGYLNVPFFYIRAILYFGIWSVIALSLRRWRGVNPETLEFNEKKKITARSAYGLLLYVLTISFAAIDWVMSLDPRWASSAYGVLLMIGQVLFSFCFIVVLTTRLAKKNVIPPIATADLHDYGNFMLMAVMFFTYISVAQGLLIWSANLPEELTWYFHRVRNGWQYVMLAIILFHFALPFLLLLQRIIKRNSAYLAKLAGFIIVIRLVDIFWAISPNFSPSLKVEWMDVAFPIALGGIWLTAFFTFLGQAPQAPATGSAAPQDRAPSEKRKR